MEPSVWPVMRRTTCCPIVEVENRVFRKVLNGFHLIHVLIIAFPSTVALQVPDLAECCLLGHPVENVVVDGVVVVDGNRGAKVAEELLANVLHGELPAEEGREGEHAY